jgi:phosphopantothenoylcysteine synthetase/decarboxylase
MNLLVTAGNTFAMIDRVRCITNVFTGRTGAAIARTAWDRGHRVTLATSHPEATFTEGDRWELRPYRTFEELHEIMADLISAGGLDAVVHCAAVSDYLCAGVFAPAPGTSFDPQTGRWQSAGPGPPALVDRAAGKVKSDESELWVRLTRAPKLVDRVRSAWRFKGVLVKFKLEVGLDNDQLLEVAEHSRRHSDADLMVANTLDGAAEYAYIGPVEGRYQRVSRSELATTLLLVVERLIA